MAQAELAINITARNQARAALKGIQGDLKGIKSSFGDVAKIAAGNFLADFAMGATRAIGDVTKSIVGMGASMAKEAADINAQISTIGSIGGLNTSELDQVKTLLNDLSLNPNLKVDLTEAGDLVEMLFRNGLKLEEIQSGAAEATVLLANATGADQATAANIATDAMALFNIEAKDMIKAVDGIASVTTNSKFDINDYGLFLAQAGGVAASLGVEHEDLNTIMAATASYFSSGSDAGTSYKTMLQTLIPKSGPAAQAMRELGLIAEDGTNAFYDQTGALRDASEISVILNKATRDLTEEQQNSYLSTIFGTDAMRTAFALANAGEVVYTDLATAQHALGVSQQELNKYIEGGITEFERLQILQSKTDATQMARQNMDNLAGDMEIFQGQLQSLRYQIGDEFQPALRNLFQGASGYLEQFGPQIVALAGQLNDAFIVPAVDAFLGKMTQITQLMSQSATMSGGMFATIGALTGGEVTIDASGLITHVAWGDFIGTLDWSAYVFSVEWGDFVGAFDWGNYITSFAWGDYISLSLDWNDYVSVFQWGDYIATWDLGSKVSKVEWGDFLYKVDWGNYVTTIAWGDYVYSLDWSGIITTLSAWGDYVENLTWDQFVTDLSNWGTYIKELDWKSVIETAIDWATWIPALSWSALVAALDWGVYLGNLVWSEYISTIDWSAALTAITWENFISTLDWAATLPALAWDSFIEKLDWLGTADTIDWATYISELTWDDVVGAAIVWGDYIAALDWSVALDTAIAWGEFISKLDWKTAIETSIDWATWIPALTWNSFVTAIDLATFVAAFAWSEYISKLTWEGVITTLTDWGAYIVSLDWGTYITNALDWSVYIAKFTWDSFVSKLEWPVIAQIAWSDYVVDFNWPTVEWPGWDDFIDSFDWPTVEWVGWNEFIAVFKWPTITWPGWSAFVPSFQWPAVPGIPADWWKSVLPGFGGGNAETPSQPDRPVADRGGGVVRGVGSNAIGTSNWRGGLTWVGETGPELVSLPRGTSIYSNSDSMALAAAGGGVNVNIGNVTVASDIDIQRLGYQIADIIQRRRNRL